MSDQDITPFRIAIPQPDVDDLQRRLAGVRWPDEPAGTGSSRGVPLADMRSMVEHWRDRFDWRSHEARLNAYPQFVTEIDGQTFHFVHVRCGAADALPVLLLHGWPSSFVEFLSMVEPLTADGYDVVIPSLPGFGFSTPVRDTGWGNLFRVAAAFAELMSRLGYQRFAVHGSDAGAGVTGMLPMVAPGVVATHVSGPGPFPLGPSVATEGLSEADSARAERFNQFQRDGLGYLHLQSTRPSTLAYSLTDSPVGQLAWIGEKYIEWTDEPLAIDDLLTIVSLYWFTRTGASSAHFVYEGMQDFRAFAEHADASGGGGLSTGGVPMGVAVFATDHSIRSLVDPTNAAAQWSEYPDGGHFPAIEVPDLLAAELSKFFGAYR